MVEPCPKFDELYSSDLTKQVKNMIEDMCPLYKKLSNMREECQRAIENAILNPEEDYDDSLLNRIFPWIHEIYRYKLTIKYYLKCVIFFTEMTYQPFISTTAEANKNGIIVSRIITCLNEVASELTEINEYSCIPDLPSGILKLNSIASGVIATEDCPELHKIRHNVFIERCYTIIMLTRRLSYIIHLMQKAVFSVRKMDPSYKITETFNSDFISMYS